jgi:hypothetical protein
MHQRRHKFTSEKNRAISPAPPDDPEPTISPRLAMVAASYTNAASFLRNRTCRGIARRGLIHLDRNQ